MNKDSSGNPSAETTGSIKAKWRQALRSERDRISPAARLSAGVSAAAHVSSLPEWGNASVVAGYLAMQSEFDCSALTARAHAEGKLIVYPRVVGPGLMRFKRWQPGQPLSVGQFGILEPPADAPTVNPKDVELFLVPLLGCDEKGIRLGYGGGFYDRVLAQSTGFRCGVGFTTQYVTGLPRDPHDQRLDGFLSEDGVIARFETTKR